MNIIGGLTHIDEIQDFGTSPELDGAFDIASAEVNGIVYLYVTGFNDDGIQILSVDENGQLSPVTSTANALDLGLNGPENLEIIRSGNETFLAVSSGLDNAITMFRIDDDDDGTDGHLIHVDTYRNLEAPDNPELDDVGQMDTLDTRNGPYLVSVANDSGSLSVFRVATNGELTLTDTLRDSDGPDLNLSSVYSVETAVIDGTGYVFTGSWGGDNGLGVYRITNNGALVEVDAETPGGSVALTSLHATTYNGQNVLIAADNQQELLMVYSIADDGSITELSRFSTLVEELGFIREVTGIQSFEVDGVQFFTAAADTDRLIVFSLDNDGNVVIVQNIVDAALLDNSSEVHIEQFGNRTFILVTAFNSDRVSVYEIGAQDDALVGTSENDRIVGMNGDDDILGLGGSDELFGGAGEDVLSGRAGNDFIDGGAGQDVIAAGRGNDIVEGGGGLDIMNGGAGVDLLSYAGSNSAVNIDLQDRITEGGHAEGDLFVNFEGVIGSSARDSIRGDAGANILSGGGAADTILGWGGADRIDGDGGSDTLDGQNGNDRVSGGAGQDNVSGGSDDDLVLGGGGADRLFGNSGDDELRGGNGSDRLNGGTGNDVLNGGGGGDVFIFSGNLGDDQIEDFNLNQDLIDMSGVDGIDNMSDLASAARTIAGSTVILLDGDSNSITITDVVEADLSASNFIFG